MNTGTQIFKKYLLTKEVKFYMHHAGLNLTSFQRNFICIMPV